MPKGTLSPHRLLLLTTLLLLALTFAPAGVSGFVAGLREPVMFVLAPISNAASFVSRSFRPARSATLPTDPDSASLAIQRNEFKTLWLDAERRIMELESQIRELQQGRATAPDIEFAAFHARVVGASSDTVSGLLTLDAGRNRGVTQGDSVAVVSGDNLVGRVVESGRLTSSVLPITRRDAGWIQALVMTGEGASGVRCHIRGTRDGVLHGDLSEGAVGVEPGQTVRLQDPEWPETAQMLVLGRVERVAPKENAPLRLEITVRPDLQLDRVQRVVLRVPVLEDSP
ncbi:MAG: hypothetical protein EA376_11585 [Phycisphaeraceae bacterium]|nr:MAG: hypothetical protein EA376_11585 [Phycisphaeraceae bacterium]